MSTGWADDDRHLLPDFDSIRPGSFMAVVLELVDRSKLNGHDLVTLLQARERLVSHLQAESIADVNEISYAGPGDADSPPRRLEDAAEFASDEIRAALILTRRAADNRMTLAVDLRERLPQVWHMLTQGLIDLSRARVFADGTAHVTVETARQVVDVLSEVAPRLTTGQLRARIRKLCIETDPEDATKRYDNAYEDRRLWIEPTVDGTANLHLLDIAVSDARAIGRRVNAHMISMRRNGDTRSHDNLRADIAVDLILGADAKKGRGLVDIRVDMTTLAALDEKAAEIPGMGPVIADVARKVADQQHKAEWRVVVTGPDGQILDIVTTSRRPTKALSRYVEATKETCSFPGCRVPAAQCDFDHILPWTNGGETSSSNGSPKCRHDHVLKDHGWAHRRRDGHDVWSSPLGRTYVTEKPP
jgi:hypothetical protein